MDDTPQLRKVRSLYWPGDTVYLRAADEPLRGTITFTHVDIGGMIDHTVMWGDREESRHYEAELTREYLPDYARESGGEEARV